MRRKEKQKMDLEKEVDFATMENNLRGRTISKIQHGTGPGMAELLFSDGGRLRMRATYEKNTPKLTILWNASTLSKLRDEVATMQKAIKDLEDAIEERQHTIDSIEEQNIKEIQDWMKKSREEPAPVKVQPETPVKKKRGRPPKAKTEQPKQKGRKRINVKLTKHKTMDGLPKLEESEPIKRKPGRPPKKKEAQPTSGIRFSVAAAEVVRKAEIHPEWVHDQLVIHRSAGTCVGKEKYQFFFKKNRGKEGQYIAVKRLKE